MNPYRVILHIKKGGVKPPSNIIQKF